jgi:hypothetical protein
MMKKVYILIYLNKNKYIKCKYIKCKCIKRIKIYIDTRKRKHRITNVSRKVER